VLRIQWCVSGCPYLCMFDGLKCIFVYSCVCVPRCTCKNLEKTASFVMKLQKANIINGKQ
jgi:hypothetical protein